MIWLGLVGIGCCLAAGAPRLDPAPRRILRIVAVFYAVSYCGRSWFLIAFNPVPGQGTFVADPILRSPTYWDGLLRLAPIAAVGLWALLAGFYAVRWLLKGGHRRTSHDRVGWRQTAIVLGAFGWAARGAALLAGTARPEALLGRLAVLPTVMLGVLIIGTTWRRSQVGRVAVVALIVGELAWTMFTVTKTPILATLAFLYLDPDRRRVRPRSVLLAGLAVIVAFGLVQPKKTELSTADYGGDPTLVYVSRVLVRFDLLRALTVAEAQGRGSYLSSGEFGERAAEAWLPSSLVGGDEPQSGELWARRMNGSTAQVSVADGPTAEGYAIAGLAGTAAFAAAAGAIIHTAGRCLQRRAGLLGVVASVYLVGSNALFERGLLGLNEAASAAAQILAMTAPVYLLTRSALRRRLTGMLPTASLAAMAV